MKPPTEQPAETLTIPDALDLSFEGFGPEAFAILDRLREEPHIEQYRKEKEDGALAHHLKDPFKRYRDDLVVNWVIPNRLDYETEKHVFSRLLKNDFGAGGCHHHKWMAFYREGYRRLTDLQLTHSINPDGFAVGLFVGEYGEELLMQAQERIEDEPKRFLSLVNPLLEDDWVFYYYRGSGASKKKTYHREPLDEVPEAVHETKGLWIRRRFSREDVLAWNAGLVRRALEAVLAVWPVYRLFGSGSEVET
jgi:hypothetical protein